MFPLLPLVLLMTDSPRIASIKAKIERAKEQIRNLKSEIDAFLESKSYTVISDDEPETGDRVFRISALREPPLGWDRWRVIVGEIVHDLRSSFDHLIWRLILANGGTPDDRTAFPVARSVKEFEAGYQRIVKGASTEAMRLIESLKPYKGSDNPILYALHRLNITDKHHLLVTVGTIRDSVAFNSDTQIRFTIRSPFLLENGTIVHRIEARFRDQPDVDMNPYFHFEVAFGEPGIFEGKPLIEGLTQLAEATNGIISIFFDTLAELQ